MGIADQADYHYVELRRRLRLVERLSAKPAVFYVHPRASFPSQAPSCVTCSLRVFFDLLGEAISVVGSLALDRVSGQRMLTLGPLALLF